MFSWPASMISYDGSTPSHSNREVCGLFPSSECSHSSDVHQCLPAATGPTNLRQPGSQPPSASTNGSQGVFETASKRCRAALEILSTPNNNTGPIAVLSQSSAPLCQPHRHNPVPSINSYHCSTEPYFRLIRTERRRRAWRENT